MAEMWKPQSIDVYRDWLTALAEEASDNLNDWETTFLDSIGLRLLDGKDLTQKQAEILERIYTEKTK